MTTQLEKPRPFNPEQSHFHSIILLKYLKLYSHKKALREARKEYEKSIKTATGYGYYT